MSKPKVYVGIEVPMIQESVELEILGEDGTVSRFQQKLTPEFVWICRQAALNLGWQRASDALNFPKAGHCRTLKKICGDLVRG